MENKIIENIFKSILLIAIVLAFYSLIYKYSSTEQVLTNTTSYNKSITLNH